MPTLQSSSILTSRRSSAERRGAVLLCAAAALFIAAFLSLICGSQKYTLYQIFAALSGGDTGDVIFKVLRYVRIPRTVACAAGGACLAVSGVLTQAVLNNAMASPNIIGVNSGAGFAVILASSLLPACPLPAAAFAGALITTMLIYFLAVKAGMSRTALILSGIAVNGILTAGMNTLKLLYPDAAVATGGFLLGSFSGVTLAAVGDAGWYMLAGMLLALAMSVELNVLQLGEESARSLGLHVGRTRFLAIAAASLLAGAAVSFAGLVSFVGLLVPHIARRFLGSDNRFLIPGSALLGGAFVTLCDILARTLFAPYELPVGVLLSLIGGVFFLVLLIRHKRRRVYD